MSSHSNTDSAPDSNNHHSIPQNQNDSNKIAFNRSHLRQTSSRLPETSHELRRRANMHRINDQYYSLPYGINHDQIRVDAELRRVLYSESSAGKVPNSKPIAFRNRRQFEEQHGPQNINSSFVYEQRKDNNVSYLADVSTNIESPHAGSLHRNDNSPIFTTNHDHFRRNLSNIYEQHENIFPTTPPNTRPYPLVQSSPTNSRQLNVLRRLIEENRQEQQTPLLNTSYEPETPQTPRIPHLPAPSPNILQRLAAQNRQNAIESAFETPGNQNTRHRTRELPPPINNYRSLNRLAQFAAEAGEEFDDSPLLNYQQNNNTIDDADLFALDEAVVPDLDSNVVGAAASNQSSPRRQFNLPISIEVPGTSYSSENSLSRSNNNNNSSNMERRSSPYRSSPVRNLISNTNNSIDSPSREMQNFVFPTSGAIDGGLDYSTMNNDLSLLINPVHNTSINYHRLNQPQIDEENEESSSINLNTTSREEQSSFRLTRQERGKRNELNKEMIAKHIGKDGRVIINDSSSPKTNSHRSRSEGIPISRKREQQQQSRANESTYTEKIIEARPISQADREQQLLSTRVQAILFEEVNNELGSRENRFDDNYLSQMPRRVASLICDRLKELSTSYKFITHIFSTHRQNYLKLGIRCFWDPNQDFYYTYVYEDDEVYCLAAAFAVRC
jgi:hypothetical protein